MTLFSNFPCAASDKVYLNVNSKDLHFLINHSDCKDLGNFYQQVTDTFDGQRFQVSYFNGLIAIQTMLAQCCKLYSEAEALGYQTGMNDTSKNASLKKIGGQTEAQLSFTELQLLMSIGIDLEDQLWAMTQSP
jgi:hypothetical protein